jgi:hypothetical protein
MEFRFNGVGSWIIHWIHSMSFPNLLSDHLYWRLKTEVILFFGHQPGRHFWRVTEIVGLHRVPCVTRCDRGCLMFTGLY